MRAVQFSGEAARLFEQAKQEYLARAEIQADDGPEQLNVGTFQLLLNDPRAALEAFENSLRLNSRLPARYPLASAYLQMGQVDQATRILRMIAPSDPNFAQAQQLLGAIAAKSIGPHP